MLGKRMEEPMMLGEKMEEMDDVGGEDEKSLVLNDGKIYNGRAWMILKRVFIEDFNNRESCL